MSPELSAPPSVDPASRVARVFVAIELNAEIRASLVRIQSDIRAQGARISWVAAELLHITLVFLGNAPIRQLVLLASLIDEAVAPVPSFEIELRGLGSFGTRRAPSVIWAGVPYYPPSLIEARDRIVSAWRGVGHSLREGSFTPHVTLGRVRDARTARSLVPFLRERNSIPIADAVRVDQVALIRSRLTPLGPVHTRLHSSRLA